MGSCVSSHKYLAAEDAVLTDEALILISPGPMARLPDDILHLIFKIIVDVDVDSFGVCYSQSFRPGK